ncbi:hypothetical protein BIW11_05334, partial [Tropilaelaps mercedesae]
MAKTVLCYAGTAALLLSLIHSVQSQLDPSDFDEAFLQQMFGELTLREETARLQEAIAKKTHQEYQNDARQAEDVEIDNPERMVRYRKEGQIS